VRDRVETLCRSPLHSGGAFVALGYSVLSLTDMALSSVAFTFGVQEANPVLADLLTHGLFVPGKIVLTVAAAGLIAWLYSRGNARPIAWAALLAMAGVNVYHLWGLSLLR
jgi:hypothetical protein